MSRLIDWFLFKRGPAALRSFLINRRRQKGMSVAGKTHLIPTKSALNLKQKPPNEQAEHISFPVQIDVKPISGEVD